MVKYNLFSVLITMQQFWEDRDIFESPQSLHLLIPPKGVQKSNEDSEPEQQRSALKSFKSRDLGTKESSRNEKKRIAGQKSRQKKKNYIKTLEDSVKKLSQEVYHYDLQISKCKDQLVDNLKTCNSHSNEHAYTFEELQKNIKSQDPNLDRINLLIDLIRNRIGANGKQRQANISYNFKQLINSMFPAIYRYILNTAFDNINFFSKQTDSEHLVQDQSDWTYELFNVLNVNNEQIRKINVMKNGIIESRLEAMDHIRRLNKAKEEIKNQGQIFQKILGIFRDDLTPIQCAKMTVFAENNKLRKQFTICADFEEIQGLPKKKVKIQETQ